MAEKETDHPTSHSCQPSLGGAGFVPNCDDYRGCLFVFFILYKPIWKESVYIIFFAGFRELQI